MQVITPPNLLPTHDNNIKIFLAGTIDNGESVDWQKDVIATIKEFEASIGYVFNPRRDKWNSDIEQSITNGDFYRQVNWELTAMESADIIAMYILKDSKSPISLAEFGLFAKSGKLVVYCEDGFYRRGNLEVMSEFYGIPLYNNKISWMKEIRNKINYIKK